MSEPTFVSRLYKSHASHRNLPQKPAVHRFANRVLEILFPHFGDEQTFPSEDAVSAQLFQLNKDLRQVLDPLSDELPAPPAVLADRFFEKLPAIYELLCKDAHAIVIEDPAASDENEVMLTYPGFFAISIYRIAHQLCGLGVPLVPRMLTEYAHQQTGIDIHPGANIGQYFCIDHGTGIVIGQTTIIGNHVKLYQGVTLGAVSVEKGLANTKRHPTIEDHVVIYAGATILGGNVTVGEYSVIGGNVWLTESVQPYSKVYHKSQIKVSSNRQREEYLEYYI
jgi:serine O-acetyltransferase